MKITPVAQSAAQTPINLDDGRSAGSDRVARAKAIAQGLTPAATQVETNPYPQHDPNIRRIKVKTQYSPERSEALQRIVEQAAALPEPTQQTAPVGQLDTNEPAQPAAEATQPLSPQFAALAREKRALQLLKKEIEAKQQAQTTPSNMMSDEEIRAKLEANPLSFLLERGVTYDKLTEAVLSQTQETNPGIQRLESEIKALKEGLENQNKTLSERDAQAEQQVLAQLKRDADQIIAQGDDFEMVREAGYAPKAVELIHKIFKKTGEIMDVTEALSLVENELLEESLKFAKLKKVQSKLSPQPVVQQPNVPQDDRQRIRMRTLTNRDAATMPLSRRDRAMLAFAGQLKR